MDKQLIERIALEVAQEAEVLDADGECPKREGVDITAYVLDFAHRYLARIDAERGKEAVAWMSPRKERLEFSRPDTVYGSHTLPLFLSPTIPEGMALVSINSWKDAYAAFQGAFDTPQMRLSDNSEYAQDARKRLSDFSEAMLAAAQGERNAD